MNKLIIACMLLASGCAYFPAQSVSSNVSQEMIRPTDYMDTNGNFNMTAYENACNVYYSTTRR